MSARMEVGQLPRIHRVPMVAVITVTAGLLLSAVVLGLAARIDSGTSTQGVSGVNGRYEAFANQVGAVGSADWVAEAAQAGFTGRLGAATTSTTSVSPQTSSIVARYAALGELGDATPLTADQMAARYAALGELGDPEPAWIQQAKDAGFTGRLGAATPLHARSYYGND